MVAILRPGIAFRPMWAASTCGTWGVAAGIPGSVQGADVHRRLRHRRGWSRSSPRPLPARNGRPW